MPMSLCFFASPLSIPFWIQVYGESQLQRYSSLSIPFWIQDERSAWRMLRRHHLSIPFWIQEIPLPPTFQRVRRPFNSFLDSRKTKEACFTYCYAGFQFLFGFKLPASHLLGPHYLCPLSIPFWIQGRTLWPSVLVQHHPFNSFLDSRYNCQAILYNWQNLPFNSFLDSRDWLTLV